MSGPTRTTPHTNSRAAVLDVIRAAGTISRFGLVFPGPLSANEGMAITPPAMRRWADFPLGGEMRRATGLPVVLDNDATAAALGEHWSGGVGMPATFAALYMGSGIGAGLIVN